MVTCMGGDPHLVDYCEVIEVHLSFFTQNCLYVRICMTLPRYFHTIETLHSAERPSPLKSPMA